MTVYTSNRETGNKGAITPALTAMVIAPLIMGFQFDSFAPTLIFGTAAGAGLLVYLLLSLRRMVGGIGSLEIAETGITVERKGVPTVMAWEHINRADFESINGTPWLTLRPAEGKPKRICLEDFEADAQREITEAIVEQMPERTSSTETWLIANRIPRSVTSRGLEITK